MRKKKVLITVGGTGGHIFPAISLAGQLAKSSKEIELLFVGGSLESNHYFNQQAFPFKSISCGSLIEKNPLRLFRNFIKMGKGFFQSRRIIKDFSPNLVVGFGSYYTLPILLAAKSFSIPLILHEANSLPGKVNRLLSKYAEVTGVHFPGTIPLLKGKSIEVGIPLREGFQKGIVEKEDARTYFGLNPRKMTLLIFGGSQGARALNHLTKDALCSLRGEANALQVLHLVGRKEPAIASFVHQYEESGIQAVVKPFEERMDLAWQASDLVIARAGASTIAEQLEFEIPGILVPYPFATDNHQDHNAEFMVKTVGGAWKFFEQDLTSEILRNKIATFLKDGTSLLKLMQDRMHDYKKRKRSIDLQTLIINHLNII